MKTIKKISLKSATLMTNEEMKMIFGGSSVGVGNSDECSATKDECETGKQCLVGGTESGVCGYEVGPGCHCKLVNPDTELPSGSDDSSDE